MGGIKGGVNHRSSRILVPALLTTPRRAVISVARSMNALGAIQRAMKRAEAGRPKIGGFPYLAECLRQAGATRNVWHLPSCQSLFYTDKGTVVIQGLPLVTGFADVPPYSESALITAIRRDQAGETTFGEFLTGTWKAGIVSYEVDFINRTVEYVGALGESYLEEYPSVEVVVI